MVTAVPRIADIEKYLRATGWEISGNWRDAQVWTRDEFDVLVPPDDDLVDVGSRIRELARCVADAESRTPEAVWGDLLHATRDSFSYRAAFGTSPVPLTAGLRAMQALRTLLAVSAREVLGDDGAPESVRTLLEHTLIGPGRDGPGAEVMLPLQAGEPDPPARRAAQQLHASAAATLPAITTTADTPLVTPAVFLALADLAGPRGSGPFSLTFRWALRRPEPGDTVRFPEGSGELLRAAGRRARAQSAPLHGVVEGSITRLSDDAEGTRHQITVRGALSVDGVVVGRRLVLVRLHDAADYHTALAAHRDGRRVRASGTATGDARGRRILAVESGDLQPLGPTTTAP